MKKTRRELVAKFEEKVSRVKSSAVELTAQSKDNMTDLAQIEANIQLLGMLKEGKIPSLDAEIEMITKKMEGAGRW